MHRDVPGRVAGGVCAALSLQLGIDPVLVRVAFVISLALSVGLAFWGYALLWVLTPFEVDAAAPAVQARDWVAGLFNKSSFNKPSAPAEDSPPPAGS
jgi:phage shock protein PspC (stress-responsive transcriptional regulator)